MWLLQQVYGVRIEDTNAERVDHRQRFVCLVTVVVVVGLDESVLDVEELLVVELVAVHVEVVIDLDYVFELIARYQLIFDSRS